MTQDGDGYGEGVRLRQVAEQVLADPVFKRSPRLSKLLEYLVEQTIAGQADTLKSITIAIEGLDRSPHDTPDAYARVQIARLRQALLAHCAAKVAKDEDCLQIQSGTYRIVLAPHRHEAAETTHGGAAGAGESLTRRRTVNRKRLILACVVAVAVAGAYVGYRRWQERVLTARWQTSDFPFLAVDVVQGKDGTVPAKNLDALEQTLLTKLSSYEGLRLGAGRPEDANLILHVSVDRDPDGYSQNFQLLDRSSGRMMWTTQSRIPDWRDEDLSKLAGDVSFQIGHTTGVVHSSYRRRSHTPDSPYACWLRFTALVETSSTIGDAALHGCAQDWHRYADQSPGAAMLRGWTLTDEALVQASDARHDALLDEALAVLFNASTLNPRSVGLHLAIMRTQAFAGKYAQMKEAGTTALELNPDSPHVQALVGMTFALWNDREGARLLHQAITGRTAPPAWYHVGLCVDAMMRGDREQEQKEMQELYPIRDNTPFMAVLFASAAARSGKLDQARAILDRPPFRTVFGGLEVDRVINRMPIAPAVRDKLKRDLKPALQD
ncbi:MAG TPA: hypothetical protein VJM34_01955 [Novosphingobium sp.]|nr:hypothetical protein [Novosphingobium sp.]